MISMASTSEYRSSEHPLSKAPPRQQLTAKLALFAHFNREANEIRRVGDTLAARH
jgi:hypothetical protein